MENTSPQRKIVKNRDWETAWRIINDTDTNLFLTGKAGTGKTTFLRYLKEHSQKRIVVLAPTGIAAINARGVTIHSFFQLPFSPFVPGAATDQQSHFRFSKEKTKIIRGTDLFVIDEISMVRADLLDSIDNTLKRLRRNNKAFGGAQLLMIGDLQQLAPVVKEEEWNMLSKYYDSPYFFDSKALNETTYATVELKKVFRQDDDTFINILNKIRGNRMDDSTLAELNKRYIPNFRPRQEEGYIQLTTHNSYAQSINEKELAKLGGQSYSFHAKIEGNYPEYSYPTNELLTLKLGAQVMFLKNDTSESHQYYNGMIGEICAINDNGFSVKSKDNGQYIEVKKEIWQNCKYKIDETTNEIKEDIEGTFSQYPVKLAWAITIHKSQGLTFQHAIIDVHSSFAHGQTYVALSRCKTLEGLVLSAPVTKEAIISDDKVDCFTKRIENCTPSENEMRAMHKRYTVNLISDVFNFTQTEIALANMTRVLDEYLYKTYPRLLTEYKSTMQSFHTNVISVANRFHSQYEKMTEATENAMTPELQERICKGAEYFLKQVSATKDLLLKSEVTTKNKQVKKQLDNAKESLRETLDMKIQILQFAANNDFSCDNYLKAKAAMLLGKEERKQKEKTRQQHKKLAIPEGDLHPALLNKLTNWRTEKMKEENLPSYCILNQNAITGVSNIMPTETEQLMQIPGIGKAKADKYGAEILHIVKEFKIEHNL